MYGYTILILSCCFSCVVLLFLYANGMELYKGRVLSSRFGLIKGKAEFKLKPHYSTNVRAGAMQKEPPLKAARICTMWGRTR